MNGGDDDKQPDDNTQTCRRLVACEEQKIQRVCDLGFTFFLSVQLLIRAQLQGVACFPAAAVFPATSILRFDLPNPPLPFSNQQTKRLGSRTLIAAHCLPYCLYFIPLPNFLHGGFEVCGTSQLLFLAIHTGQPTDTVIIKHRTSFTSKGTLPFTIVHALTFHHLQRTYLTRVLKYSDSHCRRLLLTHLPPQ